MALVIIATASHGVLSCDSNACHIGSSAALATGCKVGATVGSIASGLACTVGAVFTFGLSCAVALGATAAVAGGCAAGEIALSNGKYTYTYLISITIIIIMYYICVCINQNRTRNVIKQFSGLTFLWN